MLSTPSKSRVIVGVAAVKSIADKQNPHCTHDKAQLQPCLWCLGAGWFNSTEGSLFWFPRWDNSEFDQDLTQLLLYFIETLLEFVFWYPLPVQINHTQKRTCQKSITFGILVKVWALG